ncbi:MAG: hypothetical protein F6K10_00490, partial [Moorea sp. SIO2B7]|nr:hypothetical protein [Moorena sp. SIO2B7]
IPKTEGSCISQSKTTTNLCRLSSRKQSNVVAENAKKIHLDNIRRNLERRLQIAKDKGDENLVNLLKQEEKQLALNI